MYKMARNGLFLPRSTKIFDFISTNNNTNKNYITTDVDNDAVMIVSLDDDVNCIFNESETSMSHRN